MSEIKVFLEVKPERVFQGQIFNKDSSKRWSLGRKKVMPDGSTVMKEGTEQKAKENGEYMGKSSKCCLCQTSYQC